MGLFDFFKKKKPDEDEIPHITVKFEEPATPNNNYNPWDSKKGNSNKDYSNAVFLYWLSSGAKPLYTNMDDYPRYVSNELGICNPIKKHRELLNDGFLEPADKISILATLKVNELKAILESEGLPVKGKKADLIDRIAESVPTDKINLPDMFSVSPKGLSFMEDNSDFINLHGNPYNISYEEFIDARNKCHPAMRFNDIIWHIFQLRDDSYAWNAFGSKRNNELNRAKFLRAEKRFTGALEHYIYVLFHDVNQWNEVLPYIYNQIFELKQYFVPEMVERCYQGLYCQEVKISLMDFGRLLMDIFDGKEIYLNNYGIKKEGEGV